MSTDSTTSAGRSARAHLGWDVSMAAALTLAWAGFFVHNIADLPGQTILSPESLLPTIVWLAALAMWVIPTTRRAGAWVLLVWTVINLVGGALSVLPLPTLPFQPEQSVKHYAFHGLYAASQIPLIVVTAMGLRHRVWDRPDDAPAVAGEVSRPGRGA